MTSLDHRTRLINGLIDLASLLEAHPDLPAPSSIDAYVFPERGTDDDMRAQIDQVAAQLGTQPASSPGERDHYGTCVTFGPVEYKAVAILAAARARSDAESSYYGHIDPAV